MRPRSGRLPAQVLTVLAGGLVAISLPAWGGAESAPALLQRAQAARAEGTAAATRAHTALLRLYALDSQLAGARARLDALTARAVAVRRERARTARRLALARRNFGIAEAQLASRVRELYEQGETDPLAIVLGAESLDEAVAGLDDLKRVARLDKHLISETRAARARQATAAHALERRGAQLERLRRDAAAAASAIAATRAQQAGYVASLRTKERLAAARVASLESAAEAAQTKAATLVPAAAAAPAAPVAQGGRTLTVVSTGYSLGGTTATGLPVGWGVVAVDPSVIPLGTRITIPGYGEGVAADVGSAVAGAMIDLWFPTGAQARAWGRRAVTITLH